jgi:hypothetical protein
VINDGTANSAAVSKTITVAAIPTVKTSSGTTDFNWGNQAIVVDSGVTVTSPTTAKRASATVSVTDTNYTVYSSEDVLGFTNDDPSKYGNISGSYSSLTGALTLTYSGQAPTLAQWQAALSAVTYNDISGSPHTVNRIVSFVVNDGVNNSKASTKTIASVPTVTAITPTSGTTSGGTSVTITGTNFIGATAVNFGSTSATSFRVNSGTSITAVSPAGTGTVDITVTTAGGTSATSSNDNYSYVSDIATVTSTSYTVSAGGTASETITNVPYGTSQADFLTALTKGESHESYDTTSLQDPVVSGDKLIVTAEDGTTKVRDRKSTRLNSNHIWISRMPSCG